VDPATCSMAEGISLHLNSLLTTAFLDIEYNKHLLRISRFSRHLVANDSQQSSVQNLPTFPVDSPVMPGCHFTPPSRTTNRPCPPHTGLVIPKLAVTIKRSGSWKQRVDSERWWTHRSHLEVVALLASPSQTPQRYLEFSMP
jgi:hypothetical protein